MSVKLNISIRKMTLTLKKPRSFENCESTLTHNKKIFTTRSGGRRRERKAMEEILRLNEKGSKFWRIEL